MWTSGGHLLHQNGLLCCTALLIEDAFSQPTLEKQRAKHQSRHLLAHNKENHGPGEGHSHPGVSAQQPPQRTRTALLSIHPSCLCEQAAPQLVQHLVAPQVSATYAAEDTEEHKLKHVRALFAPSAFLCINTHGKENGWCKKSTKYKQATKLGRTRLLQSTDMISDYVLSWVHSFPSPQPHSPASSR